jgi:hypothetical protein
MKEYTQEKRNSEKFPIIRQPSQQKLQTQTKLDRLLNEISNKNNNADHLKTLLVGWDQEMNDKNQRYLLKNVSALDKINLRPKGEGKEVTKISKKIELESINDSLLSKKHSKEPSIEN